MKGNDQNGCQPYVSQNLRSSAPATEPRTRSASLTTNEQYINICRDFIWGICTKGSRCAYRHERDMECMKTILKFCHDFQNKTGCLRADCTYLHATREEQSSFLNLGQLPKVLIDRYEAMSNNSSHNTSGNLSPIHGAPGNTNAVHRTPLNVNTIHGSPGNIQDGEAHSRGSTVTFPVSSTLSKVRRAVFAPLLVPPPPPPPLPVPVSTSLVQPGPSTFAGSVQQNVSSVLQLSPPTTPLPPKFDATRPPPPLPPAVELSRKRPAVSTDARPSKARKMEEISLIENLCDNCVQRQIRTELLRQDLQNYQSGKDFKTDIYSKKCEDYEHGKLLLRSIVNATLYLFLEDYIEQDSSAGTQTQDQSLFSHVASLASGISSPNTDFMRQLLEHVLNNGTRNIMEPRSMPINNFENNPLLNSLSSLARSRAAPAKKNTAEVFQTLLDLMCDRNLTDITNDPNGSRSTDRLNLGSLPSTSSFTSAMSGLTQLMNCQKGASSSSDVQPSILATPPSVPSTSYASPVVAVPNTVMPSTPPSYIPFQPNIPPPNTRSMYPQPLGSIPGSMPNINPYNPTVRMPASSSTPPRPPTTGASTSQQPGQNNVRFPGNFPMPPRYYPPFQ